MILFKKTTDLHKYLESQTKKAVSIGFVPTMGALHEGHISLIKKSKELNKITICSIFVNPTQFNDPVDFEKYPSTLENDIYLLNASQCDILFHPSVDEVYPEGLLNRQQYDLGHLEKILEGEYRPGHFQGVCSVVHRLLDMINPDWLYLGQKDYQQCKVITKLLQLMSNEKEIRIEICPTIREADGIAMSSRNLRLNNNERKNATLLYESLVYVKKCISAGNTENVRTTAVTMLRDGSLRMDYLKIADADTLDEIIDWDGRQKIIALVAASVGNVRLIDNMLIN